MIGGISTWQLLILLLIIVLIFGTKRMRNIGSDLGGALKGFRKGVEEDPEDDSTEKLTTSDPTATGQQQKKETASDSIDKEK